MYFGRHFRSADGSTPPIMGAAPAGLRQRLDPDPPRRQRHVGGGRDRQRQRQGHARPARRRALDRRGAQPAPGRPLARRRAPRGRASSSWPRSRTATATSSWTARRWRPGWWRVADSWACTNPSLGRGASHRDDALPGPARHAARHRARRPRRLQPRRGTTPPSGAVEPWYRATLAFDRHRLAEIDAEIRGEPYRPEGDDWDIVQALQFAAGQDPDCLRRAIIEVFGPAAAGGRGVRRAAGVREDHSRWGRAGATRPPLGPDRAELLSIVAA